MTGSHQQEPSLHKAQGYAGTGNVPHQRTEDASVAMDGPAAEDATEIYVLPHLTGQESLRAALGGLAARARRMSDDYDAQQPPQDNAEL